ncbi:MAG: replicative DNA helicase, partial [Clostridia bacterium]|nr:replicative DNA helicase [Clostridia bacterium]
MPNAVKILPNSLEAEQGILACILLDTDIPMQVFPILKPEDFYSQAHKTIYATMLSLYAEGKPVDFITLVDKLENLGKMDSIGGLEYITTITNFLPSASNFQHYLNIIKNHAKRRKLIVASQQIAEKSFSNEDSTEDMNFAEQQIFKISEEEQIS